MATADPIPPEDVQVVLRSGRKMPAEPVYAGMTNGVHEWNVSTPAGAGASSDDPMVGVSIGMLPAATSVSVDATWISAR